MKQLASSVLVLGLLATFAGASGTPELQDAREKISYSIGYNLASDLKRQGVEINRETLMKGVEDALSGAEPLMPRKAITDTLADLKKSLAVAQRGKQEKVADKNLAEGDAFLAANAVKEGMRTLPSGLQVKVIQEGSGRSPNDDDTVMVNYRGTLIDGTEFDSSRKRNQPATFRVDRVIPGWTQALKLMTEGARWQIFVPAKLAYGRRGSGAGIPPGSALIFELELVSILENPPPANTSANRSDNSPPPRMPEADAASR